MKSCLECQQNDKMCFTTLSKNQQIKLRVFLILGSSNEQASSFIPFQVEISFGYFFYFQVLNKLFLDLQVVVQLNIQNLLFGEKLKRT